MVAKDQRNYLKALISVFLAVEILWNPVIKSIISGLECSSGQACVRMNEVWFKLPHPLPPKVGCCFFFSPKYLLSQDTIKIKF
jgi:hypothetical protein